MQSDKIVFARGKNTKIIRFSGPRKVKRAFKLKRNALRCV
jgi:hypothetical protein